MHLSELRWPWQGQNKEADKVNRETSIPEKMPWDRRLAERLARGSWNAANDPARRLRNPRLREQMRSPYYWVSIVACGGAVLIWSAANAVWLHVLAAVLYVAGFIEIEFARRKVLANGSCGTTTDEK